ncbi:hypothetical protein BGX26_006835 [Mortierella sp. AD094]|nr:hypothetical protein BGX26_006835 [Mortierella sp. AD094]
MSPSTDLPNEIFLHIGVYLNRHQLVNCTLVCKSWNAAFEFQLWSYLELGSEKAISQYRAEDICGKAPWIRSLVVRDCESTIRFSTLGKKCTRLRSLAITTSLNREALGKDYWEACKDLVKQNRGTLVSLTLTDMPFPASKPKYGGPNWSPLLSIAQYPHSSLRTLCLDNCKLPYRHLKAFWDICEQLEILELRRVPFELPRLHMTQRTALGSGNRQSKPNLGSRHQQRVVHFSNLLEITLDHSGPNNSLTQLEEIIRRAPKLRKLDWNTYRYAWFPIFRFMYLFSGDAKYHHTPAPQSVKHCVPLALCTTPCWPNLEYLRINGGRFKEFEHQEYQLIMETFKQLRVLDLPMYCLTSTIVESLLRLHSKTLTEIDWRRVYGTQYNSQHVEWIQQILSSCPMLTKGHFKRIHAQDIIEGGDAWVCCDHLEEFGVYISMNPHECDPPRPDMTDQEKQDMSWAVFKRLGRLHNLKILDLNSHVYRSASLQFTKSMGLSLLSGLTEMKVLRFYGNQNMAPQDVNWMIQHWKSLNRVEGRWRLSENRSRFGDRMNPWDCTVATMFNKHGIQTPGSVYPKGYLNHFDELDWNYPRNEYLTSDSQIETDLLEVFEGLDLDYRY